MGDYVQVRDHRSRNRKWVRGYIAEKRGKFIYAVNVNGKIWTRHVDHIVSCSISVPTEGTQPVEDDDVDISVMGNENEARVVEDEEINVDNVENAVENVQVPLNSRKSSRMSRKPAYLHDYVTFADNDDSS
jgi:hypothetical protein